MSYKSKTGRNMNTTSITVMTACRVALRYADSEPDVKTIMEDFGMSRACAYRWASALREARLHEAMAAFNRGLR